MTRLSSATVPDVVRPTARGIVHLGLGAFHRAHQAAFTHEASLLSGDTSWGIVGVTQRSNAVAEQLLPQDCLFTLVEKGDGIERTSVVGSIVGVLNASLDSAAVVDAITDPAVRIVTLTVTEKGYRLDPATGRLRLDDPGIASDLSGGDPKTVVGQLVAGIAQRALSNSPLTVVCCDNLPHNGTLLAGLVDDFVRNSSLPKSLADWIAANVSFPSTMVDRIVPATTDADKKFVAASTGVEDEAVVACEPFRQWVIEDRFATERPAWDLVGVQFVQDVEPWETMKLRILNATHSLLAYLGSSAGYTTIADAVADPVLQRLARLMIEENVASTLSPDMAAVAYGEEVLARFANPALPHTTRQVAMDGSQKLGPRLLGTARDAIAAGTPTAWIALAVASWCRYVIDEVRLGREVDDPMATTLAAAAAAANPVATLLDIEQIFGRDLGADSMFGTEVQRAATALFTAPLADIEKELS
jgi:fructuronate reductase